MLKKIHARQVFDSRGIPTIECEINGIRAMVPSGASAGSHEAFELRDGGKAYGGKGVEKAVSNVNKIISKKLIGKDEKKQRELDKIMIELDGTENKKKIGTNAILSVSMALCKAGALASKIPLYEYIGRLAGNKKFVLPIPMIVVIEGGKHAFNSTDIQEFLIIPFGKSFSQALSRGFGVYQNLKKYMEANGMNTNVGYEGAFAPQLDSNEKAVELISAAIEESGYRPGKDMAIAIDAAASEFYKNKKYFLKKENRELNSEGMIEYYKELSSKYPIASLEDGLAEDDWNGWVELNKELGRKIRIVGDDLTVTNIKRLKIATKLRTINSVIVKPNQIGTVSETLDFVALAKKNKLVSILSQRGGETEDTFLADFAVGLGVQQFKFGPSRSERIAKYNQLLRIEENLGKKARLARSG
jgi:enolase